MQNRECEGAACWDWGERLGVRGVRGAWWKRENTLIGLGGRVAAGRTQDVGKGIRKAMPWGQKRSAAQKRGTLPKTSPRARVSASS